MMQHYTTRCVANKLVYRHATSAVVQGTAVATIVLKLSIYATAGWQKFWNCCISNSASCLKAISEKLKLL